MSKKIEIVKVVKEGDLIGYYKTSIDSYFYLNGSGEAHGASEGERALTHSFVMDVLRKVMGKTLTIIDASIHDKVQNKATKDLLRNVISDEMEFASGWAFDQKILQKQAEEHFKDMSDEEIETSSVSIEEALGVK